MHRRPAAGLSARGPIFAEMHAVHRTRGATTTTTTDDGLRAGSGGRGAEEGARRRARRTPSYHGAVPTDGNTNLNHQAQRQQQQPAFTTNQHHQHHQHQPAFTTANCNTSNTRLHTQHSTVHAARSTVASPVECEQHAAVAAPHYGGPCR